MVWREGWIQESLFWKYILWFFTHLALLAFTPSLCLPFCKCLCDWCTFSWLANFKVACLSSVGNCACATIHTIPVSSGKQHQELDLPENSGPDFQGLSTHNEPAEELSSPLAISLGASLFKSVQRLVVPPWHSWLDCQESSLCSWKSGHLFRCCGEMSSSANLGWNPGRNGSFTIDCSGACWAVLEIWPCVF